LSRRATIRYQRPANYAEEYRLLRRWQLAARLSHGEDGCLKAGDKQES
jgi:hypothetical protein